MKKIALVVAIIGVVGLLGGCGKSEEEMKYLSDFKPTKYVELGEYKGIEVTASKAEVTDEQLQEYIDYMLTYYTEEKEVTDRDDLREGDIANLDYEGKIDGVAFDGGTAQGSTLEIGSGSFIEGFEAGMIGMKVGETKDLNLTFPENYGSEDLAGKDVVFTVKLNSINESVIPELTDEFVVSMGEDFTTVAELKDKMYNDLLESANQMRDDEIYNQIQLKLEEISKVKGAPSGFSNRIYDTMISSINESATSYGMDPGTIASYFYGVNAENYEEELKTYVNDKLVPQYIILGAIAEKEGFKVTDQELDEDLQKTLDEAGSDYTLEEYKEQIGDTESYKEYLLINKSLDFLKENAVVNEE